MRVVDIRNEPRFVDRYIELRNRHAEILTTEPVSGPETREWLRTADVEMIGLADGDALEGVAILYFERRGEVAFFVDRRGRGTGGRLLRLAEEAARRKGLSSVWAWVLKENAAARRAFEKSGYAAGEEEARTYRGVTRQGIIYRKQIA